LAIAPGADRDFALPAALFVIGVFSGAFYPLGLALLGERLPPTAIPRANAWFLSINCLGSLVSTPVSGFAMNRCGQQYIFWTGEVVVVAILLIWCLTRMNSRLRQRAMKSVCSTPNNVVSGLPAPRRNPS
jgi:MFS family permease